MIQSHFISVIVVISLTFPFPLKCDEEDCDEITKDSPWEDQKLIRPCHYETHVHPRQEPRKNRTEAEIKEFHHLAIFNIRYDLDFQEAGDPCSVRLQQEWLITGGDANNNEPVPLSEYSFNRIWYKRLCNFFSYLECIPISEVRVKSKKDLEDFTKKLSQISTTSDGSNPPPESDAAGDTLPDEFKPTIIFNDSGRDTIGMYRMKIGGRGPGKGRHKSGPGASRVDPTQLLGLPIAIPVEGYPLDGICVCSYYDPEFPDRKRPDYGMNFVEDEAREDWCVAAPGNLCGRVYFKRNLWPGQSFEFSDHIGCPRLYNGDEYECIRWQSKFPSERSRGGGLGEIPKGTPTATCEQKQEDPEFLKEAEKAAKRAELKEKRRQRTSSATKTQKTAITLLTKMYLFLLFVTF